MSKITIVSSCSCNAEINMTDDDGIECIEKINGIEVVAAFEYELDGETKKETQTYRFATCDVDEVKEKLIEALNNMTGASSEEEKSSETTEETEIEGLESGLTIEM